MSRFLIVGPPGVGKGTQAARISDSFDIPTISTGDIFRKNIADGTPLGVEVKKIVDAGDYVPDSLTNALIEDRLKAADAADGFLLDGYPRTTDQVEFLDRLLATSGHALDAVVRLLADRDEIVRRLRKRALEEGRLDDSEEAILHRQEVYRRETEPLIAMYSERGLLIEVDGLGEIDDVTSRIFSALAERGLSGAEAANG
ncbi:MAG: adenylate kinase [Actinomycetota bacterium]|nr:adenylate kinase [Actinomycetota bacterium]